MTMLIKKPAITSLRKSLVFLIIFTVSSLIKYSNLQIQYASSFSRKSFQFRAPKITVEPTDVVFDVSGRFQVNHLQLKCVANAYPEPVYSWYKEEQQSDETTGVLIDPLNDERLIITDGSLTIFYPELSKDKGKYFCAATNEYGRVLSQTVSITFGYIMEFSQKRSPERGKENWGKSISCDAPQHHPRAQFFWTKSEFPNFVQQDKRVFISQDGNLYFSSLEKIDRSNYSCQIQSSISSTGRFGPSFPLLLEPASNGQKLQFANGFPKSFPETPLAGQDVKLECMSYGYPTPSYEWTRVGRTNKLPDQYSLHNDGKVLSIPNVKIEDEGEYVCKVTSEGDSLKKSLKLTIQARPNFTLSLNDLVVGDGEVVKWECEALGIPSVTYTWFKNGDEITQIKLSSVDKLRYYIKDNKFHILDARREKDSGVYQCRATNQHGSLTTSAQLTIVNLRPNFERNPLPTSVLSMVDHNVTINCSVEAVPRAQITWVKEDPLQEDRMRVVSLVNGSLFIKNVRYSDSGTYECTAENLYGIARMKTQLTVKPAPLMIDPPQKLDFARYGDHVKLLNCEVEYDYPLEIAHVWYKNGIQLNTDDLKNLKHSLLDKGQLLIRNISYVDQANYTCQIKTSIGSVEYHGNLLIRGPPDPCGAVTADSLTYSSARVSWIDGLDHFLPITGNTIEARTNHNQTWEVVEANITAYQYQNRFDSTIPIHIVRKYYVIKTLHPWSVYEFRVSSTNELGQGLPSLQSPKYRTETSAPVARVTNLSGGGGKAGTLSVKWLPLPTYHWGAHEIWYIVFYKPSGSYEWARRELISAGGMRDAYTVNVGNENYYRLYDVKVQAVNAYGTGPSSDEVQIYSAQQMPQIQPTNIYGIAHNSTALNVTWSPIEEKDESGKLIGYKIRYWPSGKDAQTHSLTNLKRGSEPWGLVVGLQPETEYHVTVMAYNEAGSGPESESFRIRTYKAAPQRAPTSVNAEFVDGTALKVTWRGVASITTSEEPVIGYKVRYWRQDEPISTAKDVVLMLGSPLSVTINDLASGQTYKLRVLAFSSGGDGKMSSPALIVKPSI